MANQEGRTSASVTLDDDLWAEIDAFCDHRILGRSKFIELAAQRLISTSAPLPGIQEPILFSEVVESTALEPLTTGSEPYADEVETADAKRTRELPDEPVAPTPRTVRRKADVETGR